MRVCFVQQQRKKTIIVESIEFNRAKIEIVCARDHNCKFTYVRAELSLKEKKQEKNKWEQIYKREFNSHK